MCWWHDIIAGSSAPISPIWNLFSQSQHEIASTGKQIVMAGRPEVLSQSLPSFRYRLSDVYQKSLNASEQNCNVYCSKVWIQLTPKLMCAMYSKAIPLLITKNDEVEKQTKLNTYFLQDVATDSALASPTLYSVWRICRWRLLISTSS